MRLPDLFEILAITESTIEYLRSNHLSSENIKCPNFRCRMVITKIQKANRHTKFFTLTKKSADIVDLSGIIRFLPLLKSLCKKLSCSYISGQKCTQLISWKTTIHIIPFFVQNGWLYDDDSQSSDVILPFRAVRIFIQFQEWNICCRLMRLILSHIKESF
ncbi:hypothetical protein RF11_03475 [Thelohanellus kitauei]|uniref:Uncharacterized protein n=1 Tax=Thelohanellus kitauei TaxID=669202 RepID=A0A0C2M6N3_THEKT|nr:hypothetical protein RF11_03475 [Thelohanellus kitauei]